MDRKPSGCWWLLGLDGIGSLCVYRGWPVGGVDGALRAVGCGVVGAGGAVARIFARIASFGDSGGAAGRGVGVEGLGDGAILVCVACCLIRARASWLDAMGARERTPGPAKRR